MVAVSRRLVDIMLFNLAGAQKGMHAKLLKQFLSEFAEEYDIHFRGAYNYVTGGRQGLHAFVSWLCSKGFAAHMYHLAPNTDFFRDVDEDDDFPQTSTSPSYGFVIPDNDPLLVEYKLKYC